MKRTFSRKIQNKFDWSGFGKWNSVKRKKE
jgi:hypothetical protein